MIVATGALQRKPEKYRGRGVNAVGRVFDPVFLRDDAPFRVVALVAMKPGSDLLGQRRLGQQVSCELFDDELVVGLVAAGCNRAIPSEIR